MPKLVIHQEKVEDPQVLVDICPFGAMEEKDGKLSINAACKMCKLCVKKGPAGAVEYVEDEKKEELNHALKEKFKPEFLNRIDEIIVFHPLYKEDMKAILDIMLRSVTSRVMENMELKLKVTDEAQDYLIDKGFDEKYGARPLRRALQTYLEDSMAEEILEGRIERGDSVTVEKGENGLKFSVRHKRKTPVKKAE